MYLHTYIYLYICICVCIYITAHIISWHILPQFSSAWKTQYRNIFISFFDVERRGNIHGKAIFAKHSVWDVWQSSEYTTEVCCNKGEFTSSAETDSIVNTGKPWKARYFCFLGEIDHYKSYARKYFFLHCIMYLWNRMKTFARVKPNTRARNFAIML